MPGVHQSLDKWGVADSMTESQACIPHPSGDC